MAKKLIEWGGKDGKLFVPAWLDEFSLWAERKLEPRDGGYRGTAGELRQLARRGAVYRRWARPSTLRTASASE